MPVEDDLITESVERDKRFGELSGRLVLSQVLLCGRICAEASDLLALLYQRQPDSQ
jgi:hypothetical protein